MRKFDFLKSALLAILASGILLAGCAKDKQQTPPTDNRDNVVGTYPVKVTVGGMDIELFADLALTKEGDNNLKAAASVAVPDLGVMNIGIALSSLNEYDKEDDQDVTGYRYRIENQTISVGGTDMVFDGTAGYDSYDGKVYKNSSVSFISFEILDSSGNIMVKVESGAPVIRDAIVFSNFAGFFPSHYYFLHSSYVDFWFYNGDFDHENGFDGAHEMFFVEAHQPRVDHSSDYPGVAVGNYMPDTDYDGNPVTYILGDPLGEDGEVLNEPTGTFYRKVDANGNTTIYYFTSGIFTVKDNKMTANMNGFVFDEKAADGKGEAISGVIFEFEGEMGQDKFAGIILTPPLTEDFTELIFTGYWGDFEIEGSGKFLFNMSNGKAPTSGELIAATVVGYMNPADNPEEEGWVYPEPGRYTIGDDTLPFTIIPGSVNSSTMSSEGTIFYRLDHSGMINEYLEINGGYVDIIDMDAINEATGRKIFKVEFHLTSQQTTDGIVNIDQYVFEGPLWYIYREPTAEYTVPDLSSAAFFFNGNYGAGGCGDGQFEFSASDSQGMSFSMKMGVFFEAQPELADINITPGDYIFTTDMLPMTITQGFLEGDKVASGGAYLRMTKPEQQPDNSWKPVVKNWIAIQGGTVNIIRNEGHDNYTIEFKEVYGRDVQTWQPRTNISFSWTGEVGVVDYR